MFEVNVVNKNKEPNHEYCGRGSVLGNPYVMNKESERDAVCDKYEEWFYKHVNSSDRMFMHELRRLWKVGVRQGYVNLGCFCAPKRCHCDTIQDFLLEKMSV